MSIASAVGIATGATWHRTLHLSGQCRRTAASSTSHWWMGCEEGFCREPSDTPPSQCARSGRETVETQCEEVRERSKRVTRKKRVEERVALGAGRGELRHITHR